MRRMAEFALIGAVWLAVLAFGGTEPLGFAVVQVVLLGLVGLVVLAAGRTNWETTGVPVVVPMVLVALVLAQLIPLSGSSHGHAHAGGALPSSVSAATVSVAPHLTVNAFLLLVTCLAAFYLTLVVCQRRAAMNRLVLALVALGTFEAFYRLVQYLTGWQPLRTYTGEVLSPVATYINTNHLAGLLAMILPFAVALTLRELGLFSGLRANRPAWELRQGSEGRIERLVFWLVLTVVLLGGLLLTQSRMGILSALVSIVVMATLVASGRKTRRAKALLLVTILCGGLLVALWLGAWEPVWARFEALPEEYRVTGEGRWAIWQDTVQLIGRHPWLGTGLGTFAEAYPRVQTSYVNRLVRNAHNDYLEVVSDVGFPGGIVLFGSFFYLLGRAARGARVATERFNRTVALGCAGSLSALLAHSLTDFNLQIPANALVFSLVLGLAYAVTHRPLEEEV